MRRTRSGRLTVVASTLLAAAGSGLAWRAMLPVGATPGEATGASERTGQFTALTYNVAGLPAALSGSEPDVNTALISPRLNHYDLVLVQESWINPDPPVPGLEFFHEILVSQVTHPYLSEPAPPPLGGDPRRPEALVADGLNRMSRFPFGQLTRTMWQNCFGGADTSDGGAADCLSQKGFEFARTSVAPGVDIDVYNLHAEAGNTPLDQQYRRQDFEQLAEFMVTRSAGRAVIVGGDFNLRPEGQPDGDVFAAFRAATGLMDVCEVVECGEDANQIDRFLFRSGGGVTVQALSHRFERDRFRRDDGEPLSDHDPLAVTFAWSGPAAGSPSPIEPDAPPSGTTPPGPEPIEAAPAPPVRGTPRFTG